jgi:lysophospholipase L1-like esterase
LLQDQLSILRPSVLLLLHGVIDLGINGAAAIPMIRNALRLDIRNARLAGVAHIFVSTLLPLRTGTVDPRDAARPFIADANVMIRDVAALENVYLVDAELAFLQRDPTLMTLIGDDGLHPTEAGAQLLGETFFTEVTRRLELPATAPSVGTAGTSGVRIPMRLDVEIRTPPQR